MATLVLAVSIGMTTAIVTLVDAILLRPLPYAYPARLVAIAEISKASIRRFDTRSVAPANYVDWREQARSFERMAAVAVQGVNLQGLGEPERARAAICTVSLFDVLGVSAAIGRTFVAADETQAHGRVAVLSHGFWRRRFGGDPNVVGTALTVDGEAVTVVGIAPPPSDFPQGTDLWIASRRPVPEAGVDIGDQRRVRGLHYLDVVARLAPGVTAAQARAEMTAIASRLREEYPRTNAERDVTVLPLHAALVGEIRPRLLALLAGVGCVLLIACANVASLLLARAETRRAEFAVRAAVGASRGRLARQALVEGLLLAAAGGIGGLLVSRGSLSLLLWLNVADLPASVTALDGVMFGWTAAVVLGTGVLFGMAPTWRVSTIDLVTDLRRDRRGAVTGAARRRPLLLLVVMEIALTLMLASIGVVLIRNFVRLQQERPGFVREQVLTFRIAPSGSGYRGPRRLAAFYTQVLDRLSALPGVAAAGAIDNLPIVDSGSYLHFSVEGRADTPASRPAANYRTASPTYFTTLQIPLRKGRAFSNYDHADSRDVIVVNESLAREIFPSEDSIGKRLAFGVSANRAPLWLEIVGVVADVRTNGLSVPAKPEVYRPYLQAPWPGMAFVVRTAGDPHQLLPAIRREVAAIDPGQPIASISTLEDVVAAPLARPRFQAWLVTTFSTFALALAALGIYGVTAYTVAQRTREFGVRVALGASPLTVLRAIAGEGLGTAAAGAVLGVAGALAGTRVMASAMDRSAALDASALALAASLVISVTLVASVIPAFEAMRVDPMVALRDE